MGAESVLNALSDEVRTRDEAIPRASINSADEAPTAGTAIVWGDRPRFYAAEPGSPVRPLDTPKV